MRTRMKRPSCHLPGLQKFLIFLIGNDGPMNMSQIAARIQNLPFAFSLSFRLLPNLLKSGRAHSTTGASGSIGLLADGLDGTIDTASAIIAWAGAKWKKEMLGTVVTICRMFFSALSLCYEGVHAVVQGMRRGFHPVMSPFMVIGIETCVLSALVFLRVTSDFSATAAEISR